MTFSCRLAYNSAALLLGLSAFANAGVGAAGYTLAAPAGAAPDDVTRWTQPAAGIPIRVTRTYDSRRQYEAPDFGFGRSVNCQGIRLQKTPPTGLDWYRIDARSVCWICCRKALERSKWLVDS